VNEIPNADRQIFQLGKCRAGEYDLVFLFLDQTFDDHFVLIAHMFQGIYRAENGGYA